MTQLIIPPPLRKGDTVGIVSPSAPLAGLVPHRVKVGVSLLKELGFKVKIGSHSLKITNHTAGSSEERARDINDFFKDKEIKAIFTFIGGNHSNQLLRYLDYDSIRKNPKIFVGYSDMTVLHYAFQVKANLATYYGPCVMTQFGEYPRVLDYTLKFFKKEVFAEGRVYPYDIPPSETWTDELLNWFKKEDLTRPRLQQSNKGYEWLREGQALGELIGGTIPSINHLAGTEYWIDPKNKIYFLDIPESHDIYKGLSISDVDSYLADLDNLRVFEKISGLIIGRPYHYNNEESAQLKSLILKYFGYKKCPILYNVNIGHTDPIVTLRYGSIVELDSESNSFKVLG